MKLDSSDLRRYSNRLRTEGERIPILVSLGERYQVVKRERKLEKGHKVRLPNPILFPVIHLGNEGQLVYGKSKTGRQV